MPRQSYFFSIKTSLLQKLALLVLAGLCLFSFWLWPVLDNVIYQGIKILLALSVSAFFIQQFWQLPQWHWQFSLDDRGQGVVEAQGDEPENIALVQYRPAIVTPLLCILFLVKDPQNQAVKVVLPVWVDMLDDTSYRHLCRLLSRRLSE